MLKALAFMTLFMFSDAASLPALRLGELLPPNAEETKESVLVSPADILKKWRWIYDGEEYSLAIDASRRVQYLATKSVNVRTPDGVHIGQSFSELEKIKDVEIIKWTGWGYVAELPSGWNAAIFIGQTMTDRYPEPDDKVQLLFRRTTVGYKTNLSFEK